MKNLNTVLLILCSFLFINIYGQNNSDNDSGYASPPPFSINLGAYIDVFRPDSYKIMGSPRLSLQYGRFELGGFYLKKKDQEFDGEMLSAYRKSLYSNVFIKVYLFAEKSFTIEVGESVNNNTTPYYERLTRFFDNPVTGLPEMENTHDLFDLKNNNSNYYIALGYSIKLIDNLLLEPQIKLRSGKIERNSYYKDLIEDDGELFPDDADKIHFSVRETSKKYTNLTISLSVTYKFNMY